MKKPRTVKQDTFNKMLEKTKTVDKWTKFYEDKKSKWNLQYPIVENSINYIDISLKKSKTEKGYEHKAAIVKMPTGTGKTAIMSLVLNFDLEKNINRKAIIVIPSEALKNQVRDYVTIKHWEKTKMRPKHIGKAMIFEPSGYYEFKKELDKQNVHVGICTNKTLEDIYSNKDNGDSIDKDITRYEELQRDIDFIIVDEGHREPAKKWSRAVREMNKPVLLFTATPYRNDLRFFNIGRGDLSFKKINCAYRKEITFQDAIDSKCIREVKFYNDGVPYAGISKTLNRQSDINKNYVRSLFDACKVAFENTKANEPKVIIRCKSYESIDSLVDYFHSLSKEERQIFSDLLKILNVDIKDRPICIGIHEGFAKKKKHKEEENLNSEYKYTKYSAAINSEFNNAIFWIHQYKLLEGIDDENFILISFYEPFSNVRSLVQQIGRVIRRSSDDDEELCFVHSDSVYELEDLWRGYQNYEKQKDKGERIYGTEDIVYKITQAFPQWFYFDKKFSQVISSDKEKIDMIEILEKDLLVPKMTSIFKLYNTQEDNQEKDEHCYKKEMIEDWMNEISEWMLDKDVIKLDSTVQELNEYGEILEEKEGLSDHKNKRTSKSFVGIYLGFKVKPSDYLKESIFFDIKLMVSSLITYKDYLFYRGNSVNWLNSKEKSSSKRADEKYQFIERISAKNLQNLAYEEITPNENSLVVKQAGLIHSDPSRYTIRRRAMGGKDITQTASSLDDHLQALSNVVCVVGDVQRYIGFTRGSITDRKGSFTSLKGFFTWVKNLYDKLETKGNTDETSSYFMRYAIPISVTNENSLKPQYLICDMKNCKRLVNKINEEYPDENLIWPNIFEEQVVYFNDENKNTKELFRLEKLEAILRELGFNVDELPLKLEYKSRKYSIVPDEENLKVVKTIKVEKEEEEDVKIRLFLKKIIKDMISFFVMGEYNSGSSDEDTLEYFYIDGQFFSLEVPLWGENRIEALGMVYGLSCLKNTTCEKESEDLPCLANGTWPDTSIFHLLDRLSDDEFVKELNDDIKKVNNNVYSEDNPFFVPDVIICPDKAGEIADFILYKNEGITSKIVLVHAKQSSSDGSESATKLGEILDQVTKNLRFFDATALKYEKLEKHIGGEWSSQYSDTKLLRVRKKRSGDSIESICNDIRTMIRRGVDREVWVFYGCGFSNKMYHEHLNKNNPNYFIKHGAYLLVNANNAVSSSQAKLRVFTQT